MNRPSKQILEQISGLHSLPRAGVYNVRENGKLIARATDDEVQIVSKTDADGIDIVVAEGTVGKSIHIPVIVSMSGINDKVLNDFYIGDNCDITIVAGCGIHNTTSTRTSHDGIHTFHIGNNCNVKYVERHIGMGDDASPKILNPVTDVKMGSNSTFEMNTTQLGGVTSAVRKTNAKIGKNSTLVINEKILTSGMTNATTDFTVNLVGDNSKVEVVSRAVAKDTSRQSFKSNVIGKAKCFGHVECDAIISDKAYVSSTPKIIARHPDAVLVHEAAIGKISEEQQNKLMTLGLTSEQAEQKIIEGFLK